MRLSDKSLDGPQRFVLVALKVAKMVLLGEFDHFVGAPSETVPELLDSFSRHWGEYFCCELVALNT